MSKAIDKKSIREIETIVKEGLCLRCGTCVGICPKDVIILSEYYYPYFPDYEICNDCGLCLKVCPGIEVNFPEIAKQTFGEMDYDFYANGFFTKLYVGRTINENILIKATSGGVVTQILDFLLNENIIQGAIVTISDPEKPWKAKPILAKTSKEILESAQSKYSVSPVNSLLKEIENSDEKVAYVGLPCHIHGLKKAISLKRNLKDNIYLIIGLLCSTNITEVATKDMLWASKIKENDVKKIEFRKGEWPGKTEVTLKNGSQKELHHLSHKEGAYVFLAHLYPCARCLYCIDVSSEFADISVGDPWIKDEKGNYKYSGGWSLVIERTDKGKEILSQIKSKDKLILNQIPKTEFIKSNKAVVYTKKKTNLIRIERAKKRGKIVPNYYIKIPNFTTKDILNERFYSLTFIFRKSRFFQRLIIKFLVMRLGLILIYLKRFIHKLVKNNKISYK
ncbi:MAG: Coenzyme F420 hydrogenase/dehydrogenase, beta subunit C-terminal domain [Actinobacteria bacterium]|nr:Coenzyme F420 hydrogenase/dehydrogenase, beta subunit C-terminal domain [Actinomycetota bacterium]